MFDENETEDENAIPGLLITRGWGELSGRASDDPGDFYRLLPPEVPKLQSPDEARVPPETSALSSDFPAYLTSRADNRVKLLHDAFDLGFILCEMKCFHHWMIHVGIHIRKLALRGFVKPVLSSVNDKCQVACCWFS